MSTHKHTPGEWTVSLFRPQNGQPFLVDRKLPSGIRATIAIVVAGLGPDEEDRANADLIAAAPDMFAKLKTFSEWARQVNERKDVPMGIRLAAECLSEDACALIAKAKGE